MVVLLVHYYSFFTIIDARMCHNEEALVVQTSPARYLFRTGIYISSGELACA